MHCPDCLRELGDAGERCTCGGAAAGTTSTALQTRPQESALAVPLSAEARLANNLTQGFRRLVGHPQLARPLQLAKTYWPVAVIPTAVGVVAGVGVKTSLAVVGSALYWGMTVALQLLGN